MSCILQLFLSHNKPLSFWPSVTVLHYVVSLGKWYWTFRDNLVVSCPTVQILKNISLHGYVCANLYRNVGNQLTNNKASHLITQVNECSWSHSGWNWERLAAGMMQKDLKHKILKGCLAGNIRTFFDNIKMCFKETSFVCTSVLSSNLKTPF